MSKPTAPTAWDISVSLVVLFNLAVAQPLLDLVGRHPPFLIAHDASRVQIWVLLLSLTLFVPVALAGLAVLLRTIAPLAGRIFQTAVLALLIAVILLRIFSELLGALPGGLLLAIALGAGLAGGHYFHERERARTFLRIGAPLPLIVIGLFAFASPASGLLFPEAVRSPGGSQATRNVPVVVLLFDELPVASMMTLDGEIDGELFPNFERLSRDATWFRDATTVHDMTTQAVPPILSGTYPTRDDLPIYSDYPDNLFTLLGESHRVAAVEPVTALCPTTYCGEKAAETSALVSDLWILFNHIYLPDDLSGWLPALGDTWAGFDAHGDRVTDPRDPRRVVRGSDRAAHADRFVELIRPEPESSLYFLHLTLPHVPWEYLPSGHRYLQEDVPAKAPGGWLHDEWLLTQAYQRHLLQSQFADRILGRIVERLEQTGLYRRALVVALADHGITIEGGMPHRDGSPDSIGSVASVPLFVKEPFQGRSGVVDDPVETIDVVPTIVDVLDIETDADFDGHSLLGDRDPQRRREMPLEGFTIGPGRAAVTEIVKLKYELLGDRWSDPFSFVPAGVADLVGREVNDLRVSSSAGDVELVNADAYEDIDPSSKACPCLIEGRFGATPDREVPVAIAVNGVVVAVTQNSVEDDPFVDPLRFSALVAPEVFRAGSNDVAFFVIETGSDGVLQPLRRS